MIPNRQGTFNRANRYCLALGDQIANIDYGYRFRASVVSFPGGESAPAVAYRPMILSDAA